MARLPAPAGFVAIEDVREQLGVTDKTWGKRLRKSGVTTYRHPLDQRVKLLRDEDAKLLLSPVISQPNRVGKAGAA